MPRLPRRVRLARRARAAAAAPDLPSPRRGAGLHPGLGHPRRAPPPVAGPAAAGSRLGGAPVEAVTDDGSPRPGATFALWEPPLTERTGEHGAPLRGAAARGAPGAAG